MGSSAVTSSIPRRDDVSLIPSSVERVGPDTLDGGESRERSRVREEVAVLQRVAARCRPPADGVMAGERQHAMEVIEHALTKALLGSPFEIDSDVSSDGLNAALDRVRGEIRSELARRSHRASADQVIHMWSAFETVAQALTRHRRTADVLGDAELQSVSEVVHDLRSPLSSILLLSDALSQRFHSRGDEVADRQAGLIHGAALAMHGLVTDLRDMARGAQALMDPSPVTFSLSEVMSTIGSLVRPLAEEKGLAFRVSIPERVIAIGYPTALTRVLLNLVTNGLKFTDSGFVDITVSFATPDIGRFTIRDSGDGLPARITALVENALPLRTRAGPATVSGEFGVGLGLSLCVRLVHLMRGTIRVQETGRTGSCFVVEVPLTIPAASNTAPWPAPPQFVVGGQCADISYSDDSGMR